MNPRPARARWPFAKLLAAAVASLTLLAALCGLVVERTTALGDIDALESRAADHEARLRTVEDHLGEIRADVRWIRRSLETSPAPPLSRSPAPTVRSPAP